MSWESTVTYYQIINRLVQERLGGFHSAKCILHSVDFHEIEACQRAGDWERSGELLAEAAHGLERAGADCVLICTNTMHKVADAVQAATSLPLLHIAELTADELEAAGVSTVGLLGTRYTMEQDFYHPQFPGQPEGVVPLKPGLESGFDVVWADIRPGLHPGVQQIGRVHPAGEAQGALGMGCEKLVQRHV